MSYQIVIKQVTREMRKEDNYVGLGKEGADENGYSRNEKEVDVTREIYTQVVDELDLVPVINAVNTPPAKAEKAVDKTAAGIRQQ